MSTAVIDDSIESPITKETYEWFQEKLRGELAVFSRRQPVLVFRRYPEKFTIMPGNVRMDLAFPTSDLMVNGGGSFGKILVKVI